MKNRIAELRKKHNEKQETLAKLLNCTQGAISSWENGRYEPDNNSLMALANHFGVSVDYLLGRDKKMPEDFPSDISELEADLRKVNFPVDKWLLLTDEQKKILVSTVENFIKNNK